ncbi:MAG: Glyoxalase/bleomycin resistance protein/dioxygenase [Thermoleophilia bacterium]|nr:Glyoxalase/bleomycin resistance protein/dioxygenase [Thermoleophilia bacterium]
MKTTGVYPTIPTGDLERSRQFYEGKLGWRVLETAPDGSLILECGDGSTCCLYQSQFAGTADHTLLGISVEDFDTAVEQLRTKGIVFEEYDLPGLKTQDGVAEMEGEKGSWFKDPEGNIIGLTSYVRVPAHA